MNVLVIDGYNVIARGLAANPKHDLGSDEVRRGYREELIRLAKRHCVGRKGLEVRIYFDGTVARSAPELSDRQVKVLFTAGDQGADNAIIKFCRAFPKPRDIEVATEDWGTLAFHIRSLVGKILTVPELMRRLDPGRSSSRAKATAKESEEPQLSQGARQAINKTLPASWSR
ncbi:MAG: NYN domain-containing protein [Candidatus Omnitrophota bacterium]